MSNSILKRIVKAQQDTSELTGYAHPAYAASLAEFGFPHELPRSRGWILKRQIPGFEVQDAIGCYPLFTCQDWSQLHFDLDNLGGEFVSLALVASPFGNYEPADLKNCFPDVFVPFKEHFVVDLNLPRETFVHPHHRRNARRALREFHVETCIEAADFLDDWMLLYGTLVRRHMITGIAAFSENSFRKQLKVPGVNAFRATRDGITDGMLLWYVQGNVAYYHLGAYSGRGYELGASFALFDYAIKFFAEHELEWLSLGGGAGIQSQEPGLDRFKQGWSTGTRTAYFCGRVLDRAKYQEVVKTLKAPATEYFPAYRAGEFG